MVKIALRQFKDKKIKTGTVRLTKGKIVEFASLEFLGRPRALSRIIGVRREIISFCCTPPNKESVYAYDHVVFEQKEDIAIMQVQQPEEKNAFSPRMNEEIWMHGPCRGSIGDPWVLVTGSGDSFLQALILIFHSWRQWRGKILSATGESMILFRGGIINSITSIFQRLLQ